MNSRINPASLTPGADSTPEDTSTCFAPVRAIASATLSGVSPPASSHGLGQRRAEISRQSKDTPFAPRQNRVFRRLCIDENLIGHLGIEIERRNILLIGHTDRLDHRQSAARAHVPYPFRGFAAVQLDEIQWHLRHQVVQKGVIGVHHQPDLGQTNRGFDRKVACHVKRHETRAFWEKKFRPI